jgi:hypothetical protein
MVPQEAACCQILPAWNIPTKAVSRRFLRTLLTALGAKPRAVLSCLVPGIVPSLDGFADMALCSVLEAIRREMPGRMGHRSRFSIRSGSQT